MKRLIVALASFVLLISALPLAAQTSASDAALGEKLVRGVFAKPASAKLAKGFQSIHQDGARDRDSEIKTLGKLNLRNYTLSNFKVTREANVLVVSYTFTGREVIDGKQTSGKAAPRLSVFINQDGEWQWLAHANLTGIRPSIMKVDPYYRPQQ
jgi:hypothetical protein